MMKFEKLTTEEWERNAQEFEQLKDLLINWLKPIPSKEFSKVDDALWPEGFPTWRYRDRFKKTCFIRTLRELPHLSAVQKLLSYSHASEDVIAIFLCSKLSLKNWNITKTLIEYVKKDDNDACKAHLNGNYGKLLDKGFKNLCIINKTGMNEPILMSNLFEKVPPEQRLRIPECPAVMFETFMEYTPRGK